MGEEGDGKPASRWAWMGPASLWTVLGSVAISAPVLAYLWVALGDLTTPGRIFWGLGAVTLCALANLAGQSLAIFGFFAGGKARVMSIWATCIGIAGVVALLFGTVLLFWIRGLLDTGP